MNKYRTKTRSYHAKGNPPGVGAGNQQDDGLGIPTDTLASSAKSKSLRGRNRELRFICEREKRVLDWDWHRVKVGLEKEKMIFKKRALRMLEAPRHRYHTPNDEEKEEEVVISEPPAKAYMERRRQTIAGTSGLAGQNGSSSGSRTPSFNSADDCVMLEELQELNARLNVEKKACRSAPLVKNSVLTDPLYQLSSRLPKLEEEFSDMIKEHNALRKKKVEYKIKDFLVRVENFKQDQREPKGLHLLHRDPIATVTFNKENAGAKAGTENGESHLRIKQGERNLYVKTPTSNGKRQVHKVPPHSANPCNSKLRVNGSGAKRPGSSTTNDLEDDVFDPPHSQSQTNNTKPKPSKIEVEKSVMLDTWVEFAKDMSVEAMKKLVVFAAKNKSTANPKSTSQDPRGPSKGNIYKTILDSLSTGDGELR